MFVFKQKTADEMRISDVSSDVCSSYLPVVCLVGREGAPWDSSRDGAAAQVAGAGEDHFLQLLYRRRLHRSVDPGAALRHLARGGDAQRVGTQILVEDRHGHLHPLAGVLRVRIPVGDDDPARRIRLQSTEKRPGGNEGVSTGRTGWWP